MRESSSAEGLDDVTTAPARWREDFPVRWDEDNYMTRRELAKFLTLGSGLLAGANVLIAFIGLTRQAPAFPVRRIAAIADIPPGGTLLFRYPTVEDPCIVVRDNADRFDAFSQVCTHLSCAVVHRPDEQALACPCHKGSFSATDGRPLAGPPTRRLPRIVIEQRGADLVATGIEV
ncbi:MAG TPA: Rieske (2Fe-2S) protein [Vicinamibacterales bacterium]|jgi:nitrite reductase/ring-hydroxylating ferredoxin subunit